MFLELTKCVLRSSGGSFRCGCNLGYYKQLKELTQCYFLTTRFVPENEQIKSNKDFSRTYNLVCNLQNFLKAEVLTGSCECNFIAIRNQPYLHAGPD